MAKKRSRRRPATRHLRFHFIGPYPYNWPRIDEHPNSRTIRQEREESCTAACIQMLLWPNGGGLTQQELSGSDYLHGEPAPTHHILSTLHRLDPHSQWRRYLADETESFDFLDAYAPWMAFLLLADTSNWHAVIVDGTEPGSGLMMLRDPHGGTAYKMRRDEFNHRWSGAAVFAARRKT
jgi:ABC-type bacteriocin/lantibiotic exporter with double-glycine peptidase domain